MPFILPCVGRNKFLGAYIFPNIFIELEDSAPKFVEDLKDIAVKIGEEARFDVTIAGNPEPDLKW